MSTGTAEKIKVHRVVLTSEKFRNGQPISLAGTGQDPVALEINIYENINFPFLTGSIQIQDDNDIFRSVNLDGTERITIEFEMPVVGYEPFIKTFVVTNIQAIKSNDYTSLLSLSLLDETGYYDRINKVSRNYQGTGEQMIQVMLSDILRKKLYSSRPVHFKPSSPEESSYIIPYQSCLHAVNNIKNRMHTVNGLPYFCHASIATDDIVLTDLESILERGPFNKKFPFVFSQAGTNNPNRDLVSDVYNITSHQTSTIEDTLNLALKGGLGSRYTYINPTTGTVDDNKINVLNVISRLVDLGIISNDQTIPLVDDRFIPDPTNVDSRKIAEFESRVSVELSASTYPVGPLNYTEYSNSTEYELHLIKNAILAHLDKTKYTINLPGMAFLNNKVESSVGNLIAIQVFKNLDKTPPNSDYIDEKKSGNYLMLAKRHKIDIAAETHNVAVDISRLTNLDPVV